jgi:hypothetical protein
MNKINLCPQCKTGILVCCPSKDQVDEWTTYCLQCDYKGLHKRIKQTLIDFPDRREE